MNFRKHGRLITVVILILATVWIIFTASSKQKELQAVEGDVPHEGFPAPEFELVTLDGELVALEDLKGKPVVLNLWASWCPPCRKEMPAIQKVYEDYHSQGVEILAVNMTHQDRVSDAEDLISSLGLTFPVLLDESGEVAGKYQLRALPTTFFIDSEGVIRKVVVGGPMPEALLVSQVLEMLEEKE